MRKTLRYMLYTTVCIVSLIIVLTCLWWFTTSPYTKEDFIVPAPYLAMAAIDSVGTLFYADIDVPINPRWVAVDRIFGMSTQTIRDIAGSYGQVFAIGSGSSNTVSYGPYDSLGTNAQQTTNVFKQIRVDDNGMFSGIDGNDKIVYGQNINSFTTLTATAKSIAVSGGQLFAIGTDNILRYYESSRSLATPVIVSPGGKTQWKEVAFDGTVCALETDGTLWCADNNISVATRWVQQGSRKFNTISIRGGRLVGIGTDGIPYYSNTYASPSWKALPTKEYKKDTGEVVTDRKYNGQTITQLTLTTVIMFYPALDARRKRFAVTGKECGEDEEKIGNFCYAPCASGRAALGMRCPFRRKHSDPIAACSSGEYINGSCYQPCPDSSMTARGELCIGNIRTKAVREKEASTPESYLCGDGTVGARYLRIRPTNIPAVQNNKLCISKIVVKDKDGNVLSLLSGMPSVKSTIGSMSGMWIRGGLASIPIISEQKINIPGAGSSTVPLTIYVAQDTTHTKMIASDDAGTAKWYSGPASAWTSAYWTNGVSAGNRAEGKYVLALHANPVTSVATDGTCADTPIGGKSCPGAWSTYVSSTKYDTEEDGGRVSRTTKTYWDLDLGGVRQIQKIEFTGCNYVPATGATATAIDSTATSQPNSDQITGMRIQLLESENLPTTEPIAERTLGPELRQLLTFRYLTKEPGIDDTCYDACPKINGVQSVDGGQQTCIAASGGMSSRAITTPLKLPPPVCTLPTNPDGTPYTMPAKRADDSAWNIGNWVMNPTNPTQVLSCDVLPGSKLMPLINTINIPTSGAADAPKSITYVLQDPTNMPYTANDPMAPYKCVIMSNSMCASYGNFVLRGDLCVRADEGDPEMNSGGDPTWGRGWWGNSSGATSGAYRYKYGWQGWQTLKDIMLGRSPVSSPPDSSVSSRDNFKTPLIPNTTTVIADPQIFLAQCKCLNADGTVNKEAYLYNNTCVKCASSTELFYYKGAISTQFQWGDEQKNKYLSMYDDRVTRFISQKPFVSLNDAKTLCETDSFCTGITRSYDASNKAYYYMRAGTILKGRVPTTGGSGSILSSATAGSSEHTARSSDRPTLDSSWLKGAQGSNEITKGLRKGFPYSRLDIPTAFADDYLSPVPRSSSVFSIIPSTLTDLISSMTNEVFQAASAFASFQNSVQNPNTYYQLVGVERQLYVNSEPADNGICVAPCDSKHSLHDPIHMIYSAGPNGAGPKLFVLYGTTCHDATQTVISKPSIPAVYIPQVGADCTAGYNLTKEGKCLEQCDSNSKDSGSNCFGNSVRRPSIAPILSCPSGLTLVGGTCLHPCGTGYTDDGDYCQPVANTVAIPSSINCIKTAHRYSTKYQGSGATTTVNKWLCDSDYDQYLLLEGPPAAVSGTSTYVNPNDIVCYADDSSTGMYYCQSVSEAKNEVADTGRTDFSTSCDSMTKAYLDLSNNLTTLLSARTTAHTASAQTAAIEITLKSVVEKLCDSSQSGTPLCNTLRTQLAALSSNINSGSGGISGILSPIAVGASSRDNLITLLRDMKCCPVGETQYPWC